MRLPHRIPIDGFVGDRVKFLLMLAEGKSVLHLGCADPTGLQFSQDVKKAHLHLRLSSCAPELYGVDLDEVGINELVEKYEVPNLFTGDVENLENVPIDKVFDLIIAPELIEHLTNLGSFVSGVKRFMNHKSVFVMTTPNPFALKTACWAFIRRESASLEHISMFHPSGIIRLLRLYDFADVVVYTATYDWYTRKRSFRNYLANKLLWPNFNLLPQHADCLVIMAKLLS